MTSTRGRAIKEQGRDDERQSLVNPAPGGLLAASSETPVIPAMSPVTSLRWVAMVTIGLLLLVTLSECLNVNSKKMPKRMMMKQKATSNNPNIESQLPEEVYAGYGAWSEWSRCSRRCKQVRSRDCNATSECETKTLKQERACHNANCKERLLVVVPNSREQMQSQRGRNQAEFRVLYHLQNYVYSQWSEWSSCSRNCHTRRYRSCEMASVCGNSVVQEDAICYVEGGPCETQFKKNKEAAEAADKNLTGENSNKRPHPFDEQMCGVSQINHEMALRIIGGRQAMKDSWPWQVVILNKFREPFCGGTLISPSWVVTAAHCVRRRLFVRAGDHDISETEGTEQEERVLSSFVHPDFDPETVDNDIAILQLRSPLTLNRHVQPVCLPKQDEELPLFARATILGWGKRRDSAAYGTAVLHQAEVPIVPAEECRTVYEDYYISDSMLCAGFRKGRVDSCAGDSGGPLLYAKDDIWAIYGITSFGDGCGRKGKYGIYANVPQYVQWIRRIVEKHS